MIKEKIDSAQNFLNTGKEQRECKFKQQALQSKKRF